MRYPVDAKAISAELTRVVLGADRLYRARGDDGRDHLDREGLVPVHWSPLEPEPVRDWGEVLARLTALTARASSLPDPYQRDWLSEQSTAFANLARWVSGGEVAYEEVVAGTLRVDPRPPSRADLTAAKAARDVALMRAGYESFGAFRHDHLVRPGDVEGVARELIAEGRERTKRLLPGLRLRPDTIGTRVVTGTAFTAYCDYPGRAVWLNADVPLTHAELKHLLAHEAYPGHDAHMSHRDALVAASEALPDAALVVTNTASSVHFEGIAERGLDLLGWRDTDLDAVAWHHERLQWLASIEAAHGVNTGRLSDGDAARFLREFCDGEEAWVEARLRFVTHPLRAPFVYTYWWGGTVVGAWLRRVSAVRMRAAVSHLYDRLHSPSTLQAHWHEEEQPLAYR